MIGLCPCDCASFSTSWRCFCWYSRIYISYFCWDGWLTSRIIPIIFLSSDSPATLLISSSYLIAFSLFVCLFVFCSMDRLRIFQIIKFWFLIAWHFFSIHLSILVFYCKPSRGTKPLQLLCSNSSQINTHFHHSQDLVCITHSVQFSCGWLCDPRLPCPSPTPGTCSNSCPSSRWCHPTI